MHENMLNFSVNRACKPEVRNPGTDNVEVSQSAVSSRENDLFCYDRARTPMDVVIIFIIVTYGDCPGCKHGIFILSSDCSVESIDL